MKLVAAVLPKLTAVTLVKPEPVIVTDVPPEVVPADGLTDVMIGAPKVYLDPAEVVEVPAALVAVMSMVPAACAGDVAVIWVSELIVKLVAAVAPKLIAVTSVKPEPVIVTDVPPAVVPAKGLTDVITGAPKVYFEPAEVVEVPAAFIAVISIVPAAWAGDVAVIWISELIVKLVAAVAPKLTVVTEVRPEPVMVTDVPPEVVPAVGLTEVIIGAPKVYLDPAEVADVPTALVAVMFTVPAVSAGEVAVIWVSEFIVKLAAAVLPKLTAVTLVRPEPVMVTDVPPEVVPAVGLTEVITGTPKVYFEPAEVAEVPVALTAVISTVPAASAGEVAVIWVSELIVKLVAAVLPKLTAVTLVKPEPEMVTDVPPAVVPAVGLTDVMTGVPKVYLEPAEVVDVPAALVAVISIVPAACAGDVAVIWVSESIVKLAAGIAPKLIDVTVARLEPVMVTDVPPAVVPAVGLTEVMTGVPKVYLEPADVVEAPSAFVAVMSTVPAACAGDVAVICVSELMVKLVAAVAPKLTAVTLVRPEPVMVTDVPPAVEPAAGLTEVMTGVPKVYLEPAEVVEVPAALVAVISTVPAASAGEVAVICVSELIVKLVAAVLPKLTAVTSVKPEPVMVTDVPPAVEPAVGLIEVIAGAPNVYLEPAEVVEVPAALVAVISTVPAACAGDVAVIWVSEFIVKLVAAVAPKLTAVTSVKPEPVIVTDVPPVAAPAVGLTEVITGAPNVYLEPAEVVEVPAALVAVTSTVPAASVGDVAVIWVSELIVKLVAAVLPKLTAVTVLRLEPVMVTDVPPEVVPAVGLTEVMTGAPKVYLEPAEVVEVPAALTAVMSTVPAASPGEVAVIWVSESIV